MKTFLAIYTGSPASMDKWKDLSATERQERTAQGIAAWHTWMATNKAAIVQEGGPLGRTKSIGDSGIADIRNNMAAWVVVRAETHEAAAKLFVNHPHYTLFPGDGVEVMECLPVPEM